MSLTLSQWFITGDGVTGDAIAYSYDYTLVAVSYAIAVFASYTGLYQVQQFISAETPSSRMGWLGLGAFSMGAGIWSMHFVAMLAVNMHMPAQYDPLLTGLSLVFSVLASAFAFWFVSTGSKQFTKLFLGGVVLGAGIGAMHYTGMAAMHMKAVILYDPLLFAMSIVVAVALATLALRLMAYGLATEGHLTQSRLIPTAAVMGLAIALMHYTGMAATNFFPDASMEVYGLKLASSILAPITAGVTLNILWLGWIGALLSRRLKKTGTALLNSEETLQRIIATASEAIITIDNQGTIVSFNPAGHHIFGFDQSEALGKPISDLLPDFELSEWTVESDEDTPAEIKPSARNWEVKGKRKDGAEPMLEVSLSAIRVAKEDLFTAIIRDVTLRHAAEIALRNSETQRTSSEERLNSIMNSVADGVIEFSADGTIHTCNNSAGRMFGYFPDEIIGRSFTSLLSDEDHKEYQTNLEKFLDTGAAPNIGHRVELSGLRKDGSVFPLEVATNWMAIGTTINFVSLCRDITERKRHEEERDRLENDLRQAQKMESLGVLSGGIAHEINTPVQYVGDNIGFLQDAVGDLKPLYAQYEKLLDAATKSGAMSEITSETTAISEKADAEFLLGEMPNAIEQSLEGIERISQIVRAIKEFSHPEEKKRTPVDINHAIETTITVATSQWKYLADMETDLDRTIPEVPCLPGEFNQVILNLIVNAAHAIEDQGESETKGTIRISTSCKDGYAIIRVTDTGPGIPPKIIQNIFDPFFTTKEPGKGTGQGLAICHSIITKKHGGTISVSSTPGSGAEFVIRLPMDWSEEDEVAA